MSPARNLLLLASLVLLGQLGQARSLPRATPTTGPAQCLRLSQSLLQAVGRQLEFNQSKGAHPRKPAEATGTLTFYPCTVEEVEHEDITKDRSITAQACVPLELTKNESCLASRETFFLTGTSCLGSGKASLMMTLCLGSIYEDLKMYRVEFGAIQAKLQKDPKHEISVEQNMLAAVDELMQALNFSSEAVPQEISLEEPDFYKTKVKFCILLHAFRVRVATINRVISYLSSS